MIFKHFNALYTSILDVAFLVGVELRPLSVLELMIEVKDEQRMYEVYESITHIRLVHKIDWQVQEIIPALIVQVNLLQQRVLIILVGYVLDHQS